jgi:hypothetical protein
MQRGQDKGGRCLLGFRCQTRAELRNPSARVSVRAYREKGPAQWCAGPPPLPAHYPRTPAAPAQRWAVDFCLRANRKYFDPWRCQVSISCGRNESAYWSSGIQINQGRTKNPILRPELPIEPPPPIMRPIPVSATGLRRRFANLPLSRHIADHCRGGRFAMNEPTLKHILPGLFGRGWRRSARRALGYCDRQVMRIRAGTRMPSLRSLVLLERRAMELPAELEAWRQAEHARVDAEAQRRLQELAAARTQLKLLMLDPSSSGSPRRPRRISQPPRSVPPGSVSRGSVKRPQSEG